MKQALSDIRIGLQDILDTYAKGYYRLANKDAEKVSNSHGDTCYQFTAIARSTSSPNALQGKEMGKKLSNIIRQSSHLFEIGLPSESAIGWGLGYAGCYLDGDNIEFVYKVMGEPY